MEKENQKSFYFKLFVSAIFVALILGTYVYVILKGDIIHNSLSYACVGACLLLSLLFVRMSTKKLLITIALAVNVVADYFLVFSPSEENRLIGLCVFCGVQFLYLLYSLTLYKGVGIKIINIAFRVAVCLVIYVVVPKYFAVGTLEIIALMYIANSLITLLSLLFRLKKEWLLFLGLLLLFASNVFVGLSNGGIEILGLTGGFVDFITKYNIAFYAYIPAEILIALSSVWAKE